MKLSNLLMLLVLVASTFAQEGPQKMTTIDDLQSYLDKSFVDAGLSEKAPLAYCSDTRALLSLSKELMAKEDPQSIRGKQLFQLCSLTVESSVSRFNNMANMQRIITVQDSIIQTLRATKQTIAAIADTEKSKTSQLMADLEADLAIERENARRLREEADRKFAELQSSLIQVSNNARGTIISMSDILFETGKADLTPDLKTSLAKISGILMVFKTSNVIIEGHTDNTGSEELNQKLSFMRATNVRNFMIEQGVSKSRLKAVGYGFTKPIADNETEEGRKKNRRVDLVIQEK